MPIKIVRLLPFLCLAFILNACMPINSVQAPAGNYIGKNDTTFLGIPYALPPIAQLRWRAPVTMPAITSPYYAVAKRPACTQGVGFTGVLNTSENCLFLNIWRPQIRTGSLPVMVYIHGGSADRGSGGEAQYDGRMLTTFHDVIVVTINARLGIMGFLSLADFTNEGLAADGLPHSGNYNFLDQLKALEWVHNNIAAFGGDPNNVTLFGESAGAVATCLHLASPLSNRSGYFHKAIIQSGSCEFATRSQTVADAQGQYLAEHIMGCPNHARAGAIQGETANCLRAMSVTQIYALAKASSSNDDTLSATAILPLTAINDGYFIAGGKTGTTHESMQTYSNPAIPVLMGHNLNEGTLWHALSVPEVQTNDQYSNYLTATYDVAGVPGDAASLTTLYPVENFSKAINALSELDGDKFFACPARRTADTLEAKGHVVYFYELRQAQVTPFLAAFVTGLSHGLGPDLGVFHTNDIPFVFGTNSVLGDAWKTASQPTMFMMQEYWTSFAKTGVPVSKTAQNLGVANWPIYVSSTHGGSRDYMQLQSIAPAAGAQLKQAKCDYWQAHIDPAIFDVY